MEPIIICIEGEIIVIIINIIIIVID